MQVALPELQTPVTLVLNRRRRLTDEEYWAFCVANPDLRIERTAQGEIVIVPPAGLESDYQCASVITQLRNWAERDGRGKGLGSTAQFLLPNGAGRSPDAAWVSNERLSTLSKAEKQKFVPIVPEFIVEVMSPSDRLSEAREKMEEWMANGVELGWLIQTKTRTVHVYSGGRCEKKSGLTKLAGTGSVEGFILDFTDIWAGL
ncbi:MAG: Uma2 family endonuclease [Acidobacteria bacterium]|nr:Uma2 family endonuclease [Acidobacteriota bacterium]